LVYIPKSAGLAKKEEKKGKEKSKKKRNKKGRRLAVDVQLRIQSPTL
jgi:hypothetical protein